MLAVDIRTLHSNDCDFCGVVKQKRVGLQYLVILIYYTDMGSCILSFCLQIPQNIKMMPWLALNQWIDAEGEQ